MRLRRWTIAPFDDGEPCIWFDDPSPRPYFFTLRGAWRASQKWTLISYRSSEEVGCQRRPIEYRAVTR